MYLMSSLLDSAVFASFWLELGYSHQLLGGKLEDN